MNKEEVFMNRFFLESCWCCGCCWCWYGNSIENFPRELLLFFGAFVFATSARIHTNKVGDQTSCESHFRAVSNNKRSSSCWHSFQPFHNYNISTVAHFCLRFLCAVMRWNQFCMLHWRVCKILGIYRLIFSLCYNTWVEKVS